MMESAAELAPHCSLHDWVEVVVASLDVEWDHVYWLDNTDDIQFGSFDANSCSRAELDFCDMDTAEVNSSHNLNLLDIQLEAKRI